MYAFLPKQNPAPLLSNLAMVMTPSILAFMMLFRNIHSQETPLVRLSRRPSRSRMNCSGSNRPFVPPHRRPLPRDRWLADGRSPSSKGLFHMERYALVSPESQSNHRGDLRLQQRGARR